MNIFKKFQKNKENFTCEVCGRGVEGTGYTNHCPQCLWSKHVDVNPGDRQSKCLGMMKPASVLKKKGDYVLNHACQKCGFQRSNKIAKDDNFEEVIKLSKIH